MLAVLDLVLIEGDEKTRNLFTFFLRAKGHRVREARDPAEARRLAASRHVDVVLIGAKLLSPGQGSVVQDLRSVWPATPMIVIADYRLNGHPTRGASEPPPVVPAPDGEPLERPFTFNDLSTILDRIASTK